MTNAKLDKMLIPKKEVRSRNKFEVDKENKYFMQISKKRVLTLLACISLFPSYFDFYAIS